MVKGSRKVDLILAHVQATQMRPPIPHPPRKKRIIRHRHGNNELISSSVIVFPYPTYPHCMTRSNINHQHDE